MRIKYFIISLIGLAMSLSAVAQTNIGQDYKSLGENKLAKSYFMKVMRQTPAEAYYYLGQIAYEEGNLQEAKTNFQNGLNGNPESILCQIGLIKLNHKTDSKQAEKDLDEIRKSNKKDIPILIEIARACAEIGYTKGQVEALKEARKTNNKSPLIYMFEGEIFEKVGDGGKASGQYEQAKNFDPKFTLAYVKAAKVYERINATTAVDLLNQAIAIDPNYSIAYKYLADISYNKGSYSDAIPAYEKLFDTGLFSDDDAIGYAASQYFTGKYEDALATIGKGLAKDPKNYVLNRLMMYSSDALGDFEEGRTVAETFFSIPRPDTAKYMIKDHMTYANILSELDDKAGAVEEYKKVLVLDTTAVELNREIALICAEDGLYEDAGDFYVKYIEKKTHEIDPTDFYNAGNYYYRAGALTARDSLNTDKAPMLLDKADVQFAKLIELTPNLPLGYLMRARAASLKDPETTGGLAKPFYEELITVLNKQAESAEEVDEASTAQLVEAYSYLSYFYYVQFADGKTSVKPQLKDAVEKLLELEPTNHVGLQLQPVYQ